MTHQGETKRSVTVVGGLSGSGKSTFVLRYIINADYAVRFCFDPKGEFSERLGMPQADDLYSLGLRLCQGWVLFNPHSLFYGRLSDAFSFFCEWADDMSGKIPGRKVLVVSEAWQYVTARRHPQELEGCVRGGRHQLMDCVFDTQTPGQLHETIRNECTELVCFALQDDTSLKWPVSKGFNADELKALPDLHFVARNVRSRGELRGKIEL